MLPSIYRLFSTVSFKVHSFGLFSCLAESQCISFDKRSLNQSATIFTSELNQPVQTNVENTFAFTFDEVLSSEAPSWVTIIPIMIINLLICAETLFCGAIVNMILQLQEIVIT